MTELVPPEQWAVYADFMTAAAKRGIRFALGGGLALSAYTGWVRNTKDMDLFILEKDSAQVIEIVHQLGFSEYTAVPYDPTWSYRSFREGYILDFLWRMLNNKARVDANWLSLGWELHVRGVALRLLPVEELMMSKLYILRGDRSDWQDIVSLLYARGAELDWDRLFANLGEDRLLLGGVMNVFKWLCPEPSCRLPQVIWAPLGLLPPTSCHTDVDPVRATLLHSKHLLGDIT